MTDQTTTEGRLLWEPPADIRERTVFGRFLAWLEETRGLTFADYDEAWEWSVTEIEEFWGSLWEFFDIRSSQPYEKVLDERRLPGTNWFPGARLNYAEHIVGDRHPAESIAVVARSQTRGPTEVTFGELTEQVARVRVGLRRLGVGPGDRVAAYLPNIPETLVAFLATASLGAIFCSCAPEFGERSVIDRFSQVEPEVLLAVSGYRYGDKDIDRRPQVAEIRAALPSVEHVVHVPYGDGGLPDAFEWADLLAEHEPLEFAQVPFEHPIFILFSSGTTGLPKAIVHGHGGILLEHFKNHGLSWDFGPDDRLMWFSTTAWMMWNALVSSLLLGTSIVMLDGNPIYPDVTAQWQLAAETGATTLGLSPAYIMACRKQVPNPTRGLDLSRLRQICSAGSPLPPEGAAWIVGLFENGMFLSNGSGGTDVCTGIVQGTMFVPVWAGEISARCLAVKTAAFDEDGNSVVGELGELVITEPMPSMPVRFWNDPGGERFRSTYFEHYPGVWRQGDWIRFTERGSCVITGRSDATLNRGGVRLGTGEFYEVVEEHEEIVDSLVVHLEDPEAGMGELILFVVLAPDAELNDDLRSSITKELSSVLSPRHTPDVVVEMAGVPRSLTGKKLELPVKRLLQGVAPEQVASRDALADPVVLDAYVEYASQRA